MNGLLRVLNTLQMKLRLSLFVRVHFCLSLLHFSITKPKLSLSSRSVFQISRERKRDYDRVTVGLGFAWCRSGTDWLITTTWRFVIGLRSSDWIPPCINWIGASMVKKTKSRFYVQIWKKGFLFLWILNLFMVKKFYNFVWFNLCFCFSCPKVETLF